ncbi:unnamed protein product, partial [Closterium sp. NIES-53]
SSLYTLTTAPPPVSASGQVAASSQVFAAASRSSPASAPYSCRPLSHETLLWHHRLGHPSLPHLRGMASHTLVSGLPRSLPPLPPGPAPTYVPCFEGRQRAAPHSSAFPLTEAPLQTLHMDVWGPARVRGQGHEHYFVLIIDNYSRYTTVFPLHSKGEVPEVGGEFSSELLRAFCHAEGICQTFTLLGSPQRNGIAERRIGMVMDVAPFVRDTSADKLSSHAVPCVFLGFPPDAPGWQFYHPTSHRFLSSQDVTFDESVSYYHPAEPVEVAVDSGAAGGAEPAGAGTGGAVTRGAEPERVELGGAKSGGAESGRAKPGGAEPGRVEPEGTASGGSRNYPPQGPTPREMLHYTNAPRDCLTRTVARPSLAGPSRPCLSRPVPARSCPSLARRHTSRPCLIRPLRPRAALRRLLLACPGPTRPIPARLGPSRPVAGPSRPLCRPSSARSPPVEASALQPPSRGPCPTAAPVPALPSPPIAVPALQSPPVAALTCSRPLSRPCLRRPSRPMPCSHIFRGPPLLPPQSQPCLHRPSRPLPCYSHNRLECA